GVEQIRNFYGEAGVWHVDEAHPQQHNLTLYSGNIVHGRQFVHPDRRRLATTYYHPETGVGRVLTHFKHRGNLRVGAVGLGAGTLAAYLQPGQFLRFYEINPAMQRFAEKHFTFVRDVKADARGTVEIKLGDARTSLAHEPPQDYDVLILDA